MLYNCDCLIGMKLLEANSVDSIVTDPPYELGFMGKSWDKTGIANSVEMWQECLRVLKPGGHLLAFGGTRTYHRMTCAIEDAGFEIRDCIQWLYGSGFPKSMNIGKAIDKAKGATREVVGSIDTRSSFDGCQRESKAINVNWRGAEGRSDTLDLSKKTITAPSTPEAQQWDGWGTALKPSNEPIVMARKPLSEKTVATNVLLWGTGGINVDASRIPHADPKGRFPANIILDEAAGALLDEQSGQSKSVDNQRNNKASKNTCMSGDNLGHISHGHNDSGGASRFFYCAKASKADRNLGCGGLITWENAELNVLMEKLNQQLKAILGFMIQNPNEQEWNMILFGNSATEQYPKDMTSTTSTEIKLITLLKILNYSISYPTREYIRGVLRMLSDNGINLAKTVEKLSCLKQNITNEKTVYLLGVVNAVLITLLQTKDLGKQGNVHSTVKPQKLMQYLVTLVTPPGGTVLDPFAGSGSTLLAAQGLGFGYVGYELDADYCTIAENRISAWLLG